jgi:glycyl-tRNA synthetase beta chain
LRYGDVHRQSEIEYSRFSFEAADIDLNLELFDRCEVECKRLLEAGLVLPAYDYCMKSSHIFNLLDARGAISVTERQRYIGRVRNLARGCAEGYVRSRAELGFPLLGKERGERAASAFRDSLEEGLSSACRAAAAASLADVAKEARASVAVPDAARDANLLVEVGTEEIPAGFLTNALEHLGPAVEQALAGARLSHAGVSVRGTPRRLGFFVENLAARQQDLEEEMVGPPARVAFDEDGSPTKAALGFAKRNGVEIDALRRGPAEGKKGEYLLCTRREEGRSSSEVVPELIEKILRAIPWPKSMRWSDGDESFVRPTHWGKTSYGHRYLAPAAFEVRADLESYDSALRDAYVISDPQRRRTMIEAELARIEGETGAKVRPDPELVAEVSNLIEYPVGIVGTFPEEFLEVPEDAVVSAMRSHQRYFAMSGDGGALVNRFVTISGTVTSDEAVVKAGNERVLAARLADARFFYTEDQKRSLDDFAARLDGVVFQKKLGSIGAKTRRIADAALALASTIGVDQESVKRSAALCKADLVSQMVWEFPDLQGTMGRRYAELAGEQEDVALAIEEHYLPRGAGDDLPSADLGALIGLCDRLDTIVGGFAVGLAPTGSADAYGLRRAALGVLRILIDRGWSVGLPELLASAKAAYGDSVAINETVVAEVSEFLRVRMRGLLTESLPVDCVEAALAVGFAKPLDTQQRAQALAELRKRDDFEPLAAAFKRVANILKGQSPEGTPNPSVFVEADERALWEHFQAVQERVEGHLGQSDYGAALQVLSELRKPVDRFFDAVLVMDEDERVRANRLAMLGRINDTFIRIADFRQLAV